MLSVVVLSAKMDSSGQTKGGDSTSRIICSCTNHKKHEKRMVATKSTQKCTQNQSKNSHDLPWNTIALGNQWDHLQLHKPQKA